MFIQSFIAATLTTSLSHDVYKLLLLTSVSSVKTHTFKEIKMASVLG